MPALRLGPRDLLEYDGRYGVLICRECQYAIQKSALPSHLLRHRIYRGERQRLLSSINQLDLLEPGDVILPAPTSPPIDSLPIISGYRCIITGCGNLCASLKRMKRHQIEVHELPHSPSCARPAKLQTFFRGTKLKYFEVNCSTSVARAKNSPMATFYPLVKNSQPHDRRTTYSPSPHASTAALLPLPPSLLPGPCLHSLDLEALTYFHHFITKTSLTLPAPEIQESSGSYWQTEVVLQALDSQLLMYGLLAISAGHSAVLSVENSTKEGHTKKFFLFLAQFFTGWETATTLIEASVEKQPTEMTMIVGFILHCVKCALVQSVSGHEIVSDSTAAFDMQFFLRTVPKFGVPHSKLDSSEAGREYKVSQHDTLTRAASIFTMSHSKPPANSGSHSVCDDQSCIISSHLRSLPSRMAEVFGKPKNIQDFLATLSAISILTECFETSFGANTVEAAWQCMARWLLKVPNHFNHMVAQNSPVSLVLIACWSAFLVKRVEDSGCWFLVGSAKTILLQVTDQLSTHDQRARYLVESLLV